MGRRSFRNKNFYPKTHCYTAHGRVAESVEAKHRENERKREKKETERERERERKGYHRLETSYAKGVGRVIVTQGMLAVCTC